MQAIQNVHLRWKYKTRRVSVFHLRWKYKTQQVWVYLCRGVLHTPHGRSIYGTMNHDNWYGLRIRHPWDGIWWGVCNTPLPEKIKIWLASLMPWFSFASFLASRQEKKNRSSHLSDRKSIPHTFNRQTQHVWMPPCRGVLHTPHRYPIRGKRKA